MVHSIITVLLFIGAAQGFLLTIALVGLRRGSATANRILATLLATFSFTILFHTLNQVRNPRGEIGGEEWMGHIIFLLFGPLMFYYSRALTIRGFRLRPRDAFHLLPFAVVAMLLLIAGWIGLPANGTRALETLIMVIMVIQMITYLVGVLGILKRHSENIRNNFSSLERINLRWLRFVTIGQLIIWSTALVLELFKSDPRAINFVWLLVSVFMYIVGYFSISQPEIFSGGPRDDSSAGMPRKKYERSPLSPEIAESILARLDSAMKLDKPYLDVNLSLPSLSKQISVPIHHLSQVINERLGKNFFEFVNEHRVDEAKLLLKDPSKQNLTLAAIGFEAGFNSVSSFNSIFKKYTSTTPSEYRSSASGGL